MSFTVPLTIWLTTCGAPCASVWAVDACHSGSHGISPEVEERQSALELSLPSPLAAADECAQLQQCCSSGSRFPKAAMHGARVVRRTRMGPGQTSPSTRRRSAERRPHGGSPRAWILEAAARQHMKRCVRPSASWGHGHVGRCGGGTSATRNITSGGSRAGSWRAPRVSCRTQTVGAGRPRSCTVS
jgi:hypothetical protein